MGMADKLFGRSAFGFPSHSSGLHILNAKNCMPSPLKEFLSGTNSPKEHPTHQCDWVDGEDLHWIEHEPIPDEMLAFVSRDNVLSIMDFGVTNKGNLPSPNLCSRC